MNPAVERLLPQTIHPVMRHALLLALAAQEPIQVELLPTELLAPALLLVTVARDYAAPDLVDDPGKLRSRVENEVTPEESVLKQILQGATLNGKAPSYTPSQCEGCAPGEVQLRHLRLGTQFTVANPYSGAKRGQLLGLTHSRATVLWFGKGEDRRFTSSKTGEEVTIHNSGNHTSGCALECPVKPLHSVIPASESDWLRNAYKELTGAFAGKEKRK